MRLRYLLLAGGLALAVGACAGPADPGLPTASGASAAGTAPTGDPGAAFAGCMREHGQPARLPEGQSPAPAWTAAEATCRPLLPTEGTGGMSPSTAELEQLRKFAICMRAHDIEMTDPLPDGNMLIKGRLERVTRSQLEADPGYQAAMAACRDRLPPERNTKPGDGP
jgi:hypothetical protein